MISILVVFEQRLVWAWSTLILDISMVLLVLINKVVHNLHSAVWQLYPVLTFDIVSISLFNSGVDIWVSIFIITMDIITKLVIFGFLLMVRVSMVSWSWGMVGRSCMDNWGICWNWGSIWSRWCIGITGISSSHKG